jgi:hypothetical protein
VLIALVSTLTASTAGPGLYVAGGLLLASLGSLIAINYRGMGDWYLRLFVRNMNDRNVMLYRYMYGVAAAIGMFLFAVGLARI